MPQLTVTPALLDLLDRKRIFHSVTGARRWRVGNYLLAAEDLRLESFAQLFWGEHLPAAFGAFSYSHSTMRQHVKVGRYGSIGMEVFWIGGPHPADWASTSPVGYDWFLPAFGDFRSGGAPSTPFQAKPAPVVVGHDVWIGDQAAIAPGVTIGTGAIVGARALVLDDVPPYAVVVGAPARVVRLRLPERLVPELLASAWWEFTPTVLRGLPFSKPEAFLDAVRRLTAPRMSPEVVTFADLQAACTV